MLDYNDVTDKVDQYKTTEVGEHHRAIFLPTFTNPEFNIFMTIRLVVYKIIFDYHIIII